MRLTATPVPDGTVDFITSACSLEAGIAPITALTADRSASPEYVGGVPTATNSRRACASASARSVEKCRRSALLRQQLVEPGLVDRHLAGAQALDLGGVDVDAPDVAAELGEAGGRHQADVAGADHSDRGALWAHEAGKASGAGPLPEHRHVISSDASVGGNDRQTLAARLRDEHTVEGIAVVTRQSSSQ